MSAHHLIESEKFSPQPIIVRYTERGVMPRSAQIIPDQPKVWKGAGVAALAGMLFGFGAATWFGAANSFTGRAQDVVRVENSSNQPISSGISAESFPSKQVVNDMAQMSHSNFPEVEKLKTRNRRLEALIKVLQKRAQTGRHGAGPALSN